MRLDALLTQSGYQNAFCVTSWILGAWMKCLDWQDGLLDGHRAWQMSHGTFENLHATSHHQMSQGRHAPTSHCFVYGANFSMQSEARHDCSTEHCNVHWSSQSLLLHGHHIVVFALIPKKTIFWLSCLHDKWRWTFHYHFCVQAALHILINAMGHAI